MTFEINIDKYLSMLSRNHLSNNPEELKSILLKIQAEKQAQFNEIEIHKNEIINHKNEIKINKIEIKNHKLNVQKLSQENLILEDQNKHLRELVKVLRLRQFGPKSEKLEIALPSLFDEAELETKKEEAEIEIKTYKRGKPKRRPLPEHLPREEVIIDLPEEEKICKHDNTPLKKIGEEVSEQLEMIPAKIKVTRTIRYKYACPKCDESLKTAPLPAQAIPKSLAGPGLLSYILVSKYADAMPLYRMEEKLSRIGVDISRQTMAGWMIKLGELLTPIYNLLEEELMESDYISCDETRVQVLKEPGKEATSLSYMWVRAREGPGVKPIVLFDYAPGRGGKYAEELLKNYKGYLQVDGYEGYSSICAKKEIVRVGCFAHVRRKFFEALKASVKGDGKAKEGLNLIKELYRIEKQIKEKDVETRLKVRQDESKPVLTSFKKWLDNHVAKVPPTMLLGKAINYTLNQWTSLERYIEDGRLSIDNNFVENAIRPFAIGRKNWLFSDSVAGAKSSAMIYSIVQTARANKLDVDDYFRTLFTELPKAEKLEDFEKLLPIKINTKSSLSRNPEKQL